MILNAVRWLEHGQDTWRAFRFSPGSGLFPNYQCLSAPPAVLKALAGAIEFALNAKGSKREAIVQLSDDSGHTWTVHRTATGARYACDGVPSKNGELELARALLDLDQYAEIAPSDKFVGEDKDGLQLQLCVFAIHSASDGLRLSIPGAEEDPDQLLKMRAAKQIAEVAKEAARNLKRPEIAKARVLLRLARRLEPLQTAWKDVTRQLGEQGEENFSETGLAQMQQLNRELEILVDLEETARPLLEPGVSLKQLKDDLARLGQTLTEVAAALGLDPEDQSATGRDFRRPLEALSRLEAYSKLIRASQGAKKYCEQKVEPLFKKYLDFAETTVASDRDIASELESCFATLCLKLRPKEELQAPASDVRTWFDRFKGRSSNSEGDDERLGLEDARLKVQYAVSRLNELSGQMHGARTRFQSVQTILDEAHEELVKQFARLREHWLQVAKAENLPDDLDLNGLLRIAAQHGKLYALREQRQELALKVRQFSARTSKVERLLHTLRDITGSQKSTDLNNPSILLGEARDALRYVQAKRKRLTQLEVAETTHKAARLLVTQMKQRQQAIEAAWQAAFAESETKPLVLGSVEVDELIRRSGLVRALALVHASVPEKVPARLFSDATEKAAASIFIWDEIATTDAQRLGFLEQLEEGTGGELRLLLIADQGLAEMLTPLGVGHAQAAKVTPEASAPKDGKGLKPAQVTPAQIPDATAQRAGAVLPPKGKPTSKPQSAQLLNERALRTLELLQVKKP